MITVDSREPARYRRALSALVPTAAARLPAGDYTWSLADGRRVVVERKTVSDLLASLADGRWSRQSALLGACDLSIVLIEGFWGVSRERVVLHGHMTNWTIDDLQEQLLTAQMFGVHLAQATAGPRSVARRVAALHRLTTHAEALHVVARPRVLARSMRELVALSMLMALPGVGAQTARALLTRHGTVWEALHAISEGTDRQITEMQRETWQQLLH